MVPPSEKTSASRSESVTVGAPIAPPVHSEIEYEILALSASIGAAFVKVSVVAGLAGLIPIAFTRTRTVFAQR